ncbi:50S ribosomal protein L10 [Candidatus Magnetaquicoccaceae bacterium FCR-1]|uniref:Large ribosomal subunit protein uL10 n=1 Tax=Candidatus Magnetaquiglobus chichijimensis TaxID=3141448 RepID=A0ABQ0CAW9_9PROT
MNQTEKSVIIQEVQESMARSQVAIASHYRGMTVAQMTRLRREIRAAGAELRVVKNTLTRRAIQGSQFEPLGKVLTGPTILAFSKDPVAPAKVLTEFAKKHPLLIVQGGVLNGVFMNPAEIVELSKLPSREVLLARLLGTMMNPVQNIVGVLAAVPASFVRVLDRIREEKEKQAA